MNVCVPFFSRSQCIDFKSDKINEGSSSLWMISLSTECETIDVAIRCGGNRRGGGLVAAAIHCRPRWSKRESQPIEAYL